MKSHVFNDRDLLRLAGRFVWLSIDTERPQNLSFVERFPIENWPTLLVIDPTSEAVAFKWLGSATPAQLERLLESGERAVRLSSGTAAEDALAHADRLYASGKLKEASAAYRSALDRAPPGWPSRPRAVESLLLTYYGARDREACAAAARELAPPLPRGPSFANAAALGLACALAAEPSAPWRAELVSSLEPLVREAVALPGLLADDRSGFFELLVEAHKSRGDLPGAQELSLRWLAFLEQEAERAVTPEARTAFDSHRVAAALEAGAPDRVLFALEQSERDLPNDYNPAARLALVLRALGRYEEALLACDRALAKVYGPRKLRVLETRARVLLDLGDKKAARRALSEALSFAQSLPAAQRSERRIAQLREELAKLGAE